jgi:hypothetical protein
VPTPANWMPPPPGGLRGPSSVRRLHPQVREDHSVAEFQDSLENLLQRLVLIRTESWRP